VNVLEGWMVSPFSVLVRSLPEDVHITPFLEFCCCRGFKANSLVLQPIQRPEPLTLLHCTVTVLYLPLLLPCSLTHAAPWTFDPAALYRHLKRILDQVWCTTGSFRHAWALG